MRWGAVWPDVTWRGKVRGNLSSGRFPYILKSYDIDLLNVARFVGVGYRQVRFGMMR